MDKKQKFVTIAAGNISEADLIKNILEANAIKSYLKDENLGTWVPYMASPGGAGAVKIAVAESDVGRAKTIVKEMSSRESETQQRQSQEDSWICPSCGEVVEGQFAQCWNCQAMCPGSDATNT